MLKWRKKNSKGFSLVELIIVIAIMAILVGILAPQFIKYVAKSRVSSDKQNVQEVITAIQTYATDTGFSAGATIVFNYNAAATITDNANTDVAKALEEANITAPQLKSDKWEGKKITMTIAVDANGGVKITCAPTLDSLS